jgi:hypothetical protein
VWDLKINIHKRVISSFFEWDKLDCAVVEKDKVLGEFVFVCHMYFFESSLGMKLHQQMIKVIAK